MSKDTISESFLWIGDFSSENIKDYFIKFIELEEDDNIDIIPVFINSCGGEGMVQTALRDMFKSSKKPVMTVALGQALSAGAFLLAAGTKGLRFASKDAFIMIHESAGGVAGKGTDMLTDAQWTMDLTKKLYRNLADDTNMTFTQIQAKMKDIKNTDWIMTALQAKKNGLIDHIGVPRITLESSYYDIETDLSIKKEMDKIVEKYDNKKPNKKSKKKSRSRKS